MPRPNTPQGDELDLLSLLVHDYEDRKFPIDKPDPIAAIRFRMQQQGLAPKRLGPVCSAVGVGSPKYSWQTRP